MLRITITYTVHSNFYNCLVEMIDVIYRKKVPTELGAKRILTKMGIKTVVAVSRIESILEV